VDEKVGGKMKTLVTLLIPIFAFAQAPTPEETSRPSLVTELANEFAQDPRFEVTETQDGKIQVKPRTPRSPNAPDAYEQTRPTSLQRVINIGFGMGWGRFTNKTYRDAVPVQGNSEFNTGRTGSIVLEAGFRPPIKILKNLLIGGSVNMTSAFFYPPTLEEVEHIPADQRKHYFDTSNNNARELFAEWDVLIFEEVSEAALSVGGYSGSVSVTDKTHSRDYGNVTKINDHGFQARIRGMPNMFGESDAVGMSLFALLKVSTRGNYSTTFGMNLSFGPRMRIKKHVQK
jgi:hypothetical protein